MDGNDRVVEPWLEGAGRDAIALSFDRLIVSVCTIAFGRCAVEPTTHAPRQPGPLTASPLTCEHSPLTLIYELRQALFETTLFSPLDWFIKTFYDLKLDHFSHVNGKCSSVFCCPSIFLLIRSSFSLFIWNHSSCFLLG